MRTALLHQGARLALSIIVVLMSGLLLGGYALYRFDSFATGTFRPDNVVAVGQRPDPGGTPVPAAAPPGAPAARPVVATSTVPPTTGPAVSAATRPAPTPISTPAASASPTAASLAYSDSPLVERLRAGQRISVLLLGYGGAGHDGAYLTDSIEVVSVDPASATITFISVPRDLWVYIPANPDGPGDYWGKINEAYSDGVGNPDPNNPADTYRRHDSGGTLASKVVAQVLGIPIDYWVSLDFVGFRQFIDALGGVDVTVETAFTDTHYPNNDDADVDPSYKTIHFDAGPQHLDGERAIEYARSRYSPQDGTDFGRSRRQQRVMAAVVKRLATPQAVTQVFALLDALKGHFYTSFSVGDVRDLAGWAQERLRAGQRPTTQSGVIDGAQTGLLVGATAANGEDILLPAAGQGDYSAIHRYVQRLLDGQNP
ncbi:MAG TPA: LCP family protein [Thermomicrobiales bacterium]|nr:LCP family protein [Thermomicrobiales bacterium]